MDEIEELAEKLELGLHRPYDSVSVLCVYWEGSEILGFQKEAREVMKLFSEDFQFKTQEYAIPLVYADLKLHGRIHQFIEAEKQDPRTLLIIHYGGHGDPNTQPTDDEDKRKLVLAA